MAPLDRPIVVADAGPLIHLDELGCLDLLADFSAVHTTEQVWREVLRHRSALTPKAISGLRLEKSAWPVGSAMAVLAEAFDLDAGELSALGLMQHLSADLFLCDDAAARLVAESLGYGVHGTIGLVIRGIRRQQRTSNRCWKFSERFRCVRHCSSSRHCWLKSVTGLSGKCSTHRRNDDSMRCG